MNEAEELRSLRDENHRLKKLVAVSLDRDMLKSVISKNGHSSRFEGAARSSSGDARHLLSNFPTSVRRACELGPDTTIRGIDSSETRNATSRCACA